ncbi:MAG: hypothetical protein NC204_00120 [Candidatus Amulumruptor caecigallinarius]|nr:hypothetical protein [Candidatus Amulumruptor caecigallinarius]
MKKTSILLAAAAMAFGFSSCTQEDEPKFHMPTTFTIAVPGLQNQEFTTANDMTDPATFNLFCSQPDYGYSAICNYSALVSLDPECPIETAVALENTTPTSAAMSIKTFELGAAACKLLGITSQEDFDKSVYATQPVTCYFRAVCSIDGIDGSEIISSNVVSYNKVRLQFAEKKPGWIYIVGDVINLDNGVVDGFKGPNTANEAHYNDNFRLFEPQEKIGEKIYVGTFGINPKVKDPDKSYEDNCSQFRFFTYLGGWNADPSLGSNEADFYCLSITDKYEGGYTGDVVNQGLGNWGIYTDDVVPVTIVVDVQMLKIYVKQGIHNVAFTGRDPEFN